MEHGSRNKGEMMGMTLRESADILADLGKSAPADSLINQLAQIAKKAADDIENLNA